LIALARRTAWVNSSLAWSEFDMAYNWRPPAVM
jgi:hypothetical protein